MEETESYSQYPNHFSFYDFLARKSRRKFDVMNNDEELEIIFSDFNFLEPFL